MSRSGVFYVVKAMERTVAGTAAADAPRVPAGQAIDHEATAAGPDGSAPSFVRRVLAAVRLSLGGAPGPAGRGRRTVGGAARAD